MPEKKNSIFNEKFFAWLLVIVFALTFVTAILLSLTLPFSNVSGVASAEWIPSGDANTRYVFNSLSQDFVGNVGLWYNLGVNMSSDSTYYDSFINSILWRGDSSVYYNTEDNFGYRVGVIGFLYGYEIDYKGVRYYRLDNPSSYRKVVFPLAIIERFRVSDDFILFRNLSLVSLSSLSGDFPAEHSTFITTRYLDSIGGSADMRVAVNSTIKNAGNYTLPVDSFPMVNGFARFPLAAAQSGTGKSANYYLSLQGFVHDFSKVDSSYTNMWYGSLPVGLTSDSLIQVLTLLSQVMSFGYTSQVMDTNESAYQSGYVNGVQDQKDREEKLLKDKYNDGYSAGKVAGYNDGYIAGKDVSDNYTFLGLIGAVFDAPIEAFKGLFNFEILGTNMQGFVLALLTLSVLLVIIKFALGGK